MTCDFTTIVGYTLKARRVGGAFLVASLQRMKPLVCFVVCLCCNSSIQYGYYYDYRGDIVMMVQGGTHRLKVCCNNRFLWSVVLLSSAPLLFGYSLIVVVSVSTVCTIQKSIFLLPSSSKLSPAVSFWLNMPFLSWKHIPNIIQVACTINRFILRSSSYGTWNYALLVFTCFGGKLYLEDVFSSSP